MKCWMGMDNLRFVPEQNIYYFPNFVHGKDLFQRSKINFMVLIKCV